VGTNAAKVLFNKLRHRASFADTTRTQIEIEVIAQAMDFIC
jgi:hypothetical protein